MSAPMPPPPPSEYRPAGPGSARPPGTVSAAFWTFMAMAALALLTIVLVFTSGTLDEAVQQAGTGSGMDVESLVSTLRVTTLIVFGIVIGLLIFFAIKMRFGRNWARIVLTVLAALSMVSRFTVTTSVTINGQEYTEQSGQLVGWISAGLALLAIVLMYLPASNAYFAGRRS